MSHAHRDPDTYVERLVESLHRRLGALERGPAGTLPYTAVRQMGDVSGVVSTSYIELTRAEFGYGRIPFFKTYWDAGLRPQFLLTGFLNNNTGGQTTRLSFNLRGWSDGDTSEVTVLAADDTRAIAVTGTTSTWKSSGWIAPALAAPTKDHVNVVAQGRVTGGSGGFLVCSIHVRWLRV